LFNYSLRSNILVCSDLFNLYYVFTSQSFSARARWKKPDFKRPKVAPLVYEAHIGMAQEEEKIGSFREFTLGVLPRIANAGYNTLQLMAIQEHPYYGSFGYQVSSFFAPSSRYGTPEDLKLLIDTAHAQGLTVFMDLIH
jgi:1,4-alpha-glucan branching enzyme